MQQTNTDCLQAKIEVLQILSNTLQDKSEALQAAGRKPQDELKIFQELRKTFQDNRKVFQYTKELSSRQEGSTPTHSFQSLRQETGTYFMCVNGRVIN